MRSEGAGDFRGRSRKNHDDLAANVEAGEVIVIFLGNFESVSRKYERSFNLRCWHDACADDGIFAERECFAVAVADEGEAAIFLDNLAGDEFNRLIVAVYAGRFRARSLELLDRVLLRFALAAAAGIATFKFVVGEELDMVPPGLAVKVRSGLGRSGNCEEECQQQSQ